MEPREYLTTHPWLTYDVRKQLEHAPRKLWQLLGGVSSLANVLADTPLLPEVATEMHMVYLVKGALATTAIEGNTLTEDQVRQAVDRDLKLPPSKEYLEIEIMNMVEAFNQLSAELDEDGTKAVLTPARIDDMNRQVLKNLELEPGVVPGEVSSHQVVVGGYRGAPRRDVDYLMNELCSWLENGRENDDEGVSKESMDDAVLKALLAHLYLAWIHGYGDGNGRTARLVEFFILLRGGVPAPAAHLLSNHFNDTRSAYYRELAKASASGGEVVPFLVYALQGFLDGLDGQLDRIRLQTEQLVWQRLVHEAITQSTVTAHRRRQVALALFDVTGTVSKDDLILMNPTVFRLYRGCSMKTVTRDVHVLEQAGLIRKVSGGYRTTRGQILGLMPRRLR